MCDNRTFGIPHDEATSTVGIVFLAASNAVFIAASVIAYRYRFYFPSAAYVAIFFFSTLYHICKPINGWCLFSFAYLFGADFMFAFLTVPITLHYFLPFDNPVVTTPTTSMAPRLTTISMNTRRTDSSPPPMVTISSSSSSSTGSGGGVPNFLHGKEILFVIFDMVLIATLISLGLTNLWGYLAISGIAMAYTLAIILVFGLHYKVWPYMTWLFVGLGAGLLVLGTGLFLGQELFPNPEVYAGIHSPWHILAGLGQIALIFSRVRLDRSSRLLDTDDKKRNEALRQRNLQRSSAWTISRV